MCDFFLDLVVLFKVTYPCQQGISVHVGPSLSSTNLGLRFDQVRLANPVSESFGVQGWSRGTTYRSLQ